MTLKDGYKRISFQVPQDLYDKLYAIAKARRVHPSQRPNISTELLLAFEQHCNTVTAADPQTPSADE